MLIWALRPSGLLKAGTPFEIFLATKVAGGEGHLAYQSILRACDASLQRLRTDIAHYLGGTFGDFFGRKQFRRG